MKLNIEWIKRHGIIPSLIVFITSILLEVINNMLGNIISDMLPKSVFIMFLLVSLLACFAWMKNQHEKQANTTPDQPHQSAPKAPAPSIHHARVSALTTTTVPRSFQTNRSTEFPLSLDESGNEQFIDDPLPSKSPEKAVPSPKEQIAALPAQPTKIKYSRQLPEQPKMLCWSPDSSCLAALCPSAPLQLIGEQDTILLPDWGAVQAANWSPNGQTLAISTQGTIHFWNRNDGRESAEPLRISANPVYGMDWSDQQRLAFWVENEILIFSFPDLRCLAVFPTPHTCSKTPGLLRWSPDGSWLVAGTTNDGGSLVCWHYDTAIRFQLSSHLRLVCMAWHPASSLLNVALSTRQIITWDVAKQQQVAMPGKLAVTPHTMSISPRYGLLLASLANALLVGPATSSFPTGKYAGYWIAEWSPDDTMFATLDPGKKTAVQICSLPLRTAS